MPSLTHAERDFHRLARRVFDVPYELYYVSTYVKDALSVTKSVQVPMLLLHELAHWLFHYNRNAFDRMFQISKLSIYDKQMSKARCHFDM